MTTPDERQALIDEYLAGEAGRGRDVQDTEVQFQAAAYADRVLGNRAWEQQRIEAIEAFKAQSQRAAHAQRQAGPDRRAVFEANKLRTGDDAAGDAWAKQVAANVARHSDPSEQARQQRAADVRLAAGQRERTARRAALRQQLAVQAGGNHWRALVEQAKQLRQALNDLDAELFREAVRPQDEPKGAGDALVSSARGGVRSEFTAHPEGM